MIFRALSKLTTFPLSVKWDCVVEKKICISFLFLVFTKLIEFKHVHEVFVIKKNKQIQI